MKSNKALIIIDIQNDYFSGGANPLVGSFEASMNAKDILNYFREQSFAVIHIQHVSTRPDSSYFLPYTFGVGIHENVKPLDGEKVIVKHYPNSFRATELLEYLESNEISDLIICGMMTHICIDSTVRAAKDFGFNCTLITDACATKDLEINGQIIKAEDVQNSFFAALSYFYSSVVTKIQLFEKFN